MEEIEREEITLFSSELARLREGFFLSRDYYTDILTGPLTEDERAFCNATLQIIDDYIKSLTHYINTGNYKHPEYLSSSKNQPKKEESV